MLRTAIFLLLALALLTYVTAAPSSKSNGKGPKGNNGTSSSSSSSSGKNAGRKYPKYGFPIKGISKEINGKQYSDCSGMVRYESYKTDFSNPIKPCMIAQKVWVTDFKCTNPKLPKGQYPIEMKDVPVGYSGYQGLFSGSGDFDVPESGVGEINMPEARACQK
jgi:hypothetical protein